MACDSVPVGRQCIQYTPWHAVDAINLKPDTTGPFVGGGFITTHRPARRARMPPVTVFDQSVPEFTWGGLTPNAPYEVYVFGLSDDLNNHRVTIQPGPNQVSFIQSGNGACCG